MTLPIAEPWLPWLQSLGNTAVSAFGPWMPRLAAAVGPAVDVLEHDPSGEPDGWTGLTRRGRWERLLATEWALADEVPDEFLRRVAAGEQLFVRMDHRQPQEGPWCVVLCDTGPAQLGLPRLVQCALIAALCWRRGVRGRVVVGALQGSELWEPALARSTGRSLWRSRSRVPPTDADARRWAARLEEEAEEAGADRPEVWLLGGGDAVGLSLPNTSRVRIGERPLGDTTQPELDVHRARGTTLRVVLPPTPHRSTSLLSDPFAPSHPSPMLDPGGPTTIAHGRSRHLLVRRGQVVELWSAPRRDHHVPGTAELTHRIRLLGEDREEGMLIGAGRVKQRLATLRLHGDELVYHSRFGTRRMPCPAPLRVPSADAPLGPLHGGRTSVTVVDGASVVWGLDFADGVQRSLGRTEHPVVFGNNTLQWLEAGGVRQTRDGARAEPVWIGEGPPIEGVVTSPGQHWVGALRGGRWIGLCPGDGSWGGLGPATPPGEPHATPLGLAASREWVVREALGVGVLAPAGFELRVPLPGGAADVRLDPEGETITVLSEDRSQIRFYDLRTGSLWASRRLQ